MGGSAGEGIWIIDLKNKNYCANFGDRVAGMNEMLVCKEANDNHGEEHTVAEFIEWCENGRTAKSGKWTSKGTGAYFEGGVEAGGQMVDQRFCPRISEGEARFVMIGRKCFRVEHYVYIGGVGGETKTTIYPVSSPDFPDSADLHPSTRSLGKGHSSSLGCRFHSSGWTQVTDGDRRVQLLMLGARRIFG